LGKITLSDPSSWT